LGDRQQPALVLSPNPFYQIYEGAALLAGATPYYLPFLRMGFPIFDRIGNAHRLMVGYRGTRAFLFEVANLMMGHLPHATPDHWPLPEAAQRVARPGVSVSTPTGVTP